MRGLSRKMASEYEKAVTKHLTECLGEPVEDGSFLCWNLPVYGGFIQISLACDSRKTERGAYRSRNLFSRYSGCHNRYAPSGKNNAYISSSDTTEQAVRHTIMHVRGMADFGSPERERLDAAYLATLAEG